MNRKTVVRIGAYVMLLSLVMTLFIGAMSVKADTLKPLTAGVPSASQAPARPWSPSQVGPNGDIDGDGIPNNEDPDIDGDGIPNGLDPDIDGDGIPNAQDTNPTSTNLTGFVPPKLASPQGHLWQWGGGAAVLAVLGWLVALPWVRRRRGTSTKR